MIVGHTEQVSSGISQVPFTTKNEKKKKLNKDKFMLELLLAKTIMV
jgi:hypothetical protein